VEVKSVDEVRQNWEQIKAAKGDKRCPVAQYQTQPNSPDTASNDSWDEDFKKAAAAGFEWENIDGVWAKFYEAEFQQAITQETPEQQQAELGDLLFILINLARWYNLDPTNALQGTNQRFIQRLSQMEAFADRPSDYTLAELETLCSRLSPARQ